MREPVICTCFDFAQRISFVISLFIVAVFTAINKCYPETRAWLGNIQYQAVSISQVAGSEKE